MIVLSCRLQIQGQEHVDGIVDQESHKPFQVYKQDYVEHPAEQMTEEERKKYEEEIQQQKDLMDSSLKAEEDQSPGSDEGGSGRAHVVSSQVIICVNDGAGAPDTPAPTLSRDRPMSERTPQHAGKSAVVDDDDDIGVRRTQSARTTKKKSSREPVDEGDDVKDKSATMRSTDSGEVSGRSSREGSPTKLGEKEKKKKKKKGFRTPSFLKGKKKDKHKDE
ncbi:PREDICTED: uncharacterized protein LOC106812372 isoform X1 [Priapulus caudatus]|uniref:Uncharacterized protein LOC106812372 isoform X1 n=1 Tax=Priapulus caudatus TaxID=37621 RepID=A0ABM1EHP3_PRICU|nr:PREDICTED: uncharacterized protein LOC106812372 isoform X1 [Priapulus caudatus]